MSMTDPIADYLTRIRNAIRAKHPRVDIPASRLKKEITRILKDEGFIKGYKLISYQGHQYLRILLKYQDHGESVIEGLEKVSTPGLRKYVAKDEIPRILDGLGITILSTSRGVMTGKKAKSMNLGGEIICNIW
jgi:small subunit ribosomal protein S8